MMRSKPIRKRRRVRRGPWRSKPYREFVASHECMICGGASQAAHTEKNGKSSKGSDASCVPLCPPHHDIIDLRGILPNGEWGKEALEAYYNVDLSNYAAQLYALWCEKKGKAA